MSKVRKTPKLVVATPKDTIPQGSTLRSDSKLAQAVLKEGKGKIIRSSPVEGKDDDRDILIRRVLKF